MNVKRVGVGFLVLFFLLITLGFSAAESGQTMKSKFALGRYPDFKIGILANNFIKPLPLSKDNMMKIIDWASLNGLSWIEIRDPRADLTYMECQELAAYAVSRKIEIIYALNIGFLDPQFAEVFARGCANASLFAGPRVIRTSAPGPEFTADPKKAAWTKEEFDKLIQIANNAANTAKLVGLQLVIEHAFETMQGDGTTTFGMVEIQTMGNSNIGSQYDTANFFAVSRTPVSPEKAKSYYERFANKTYYVHIKTSNREHKVTDITSDNELDLGVIFDILAKARINYLALEINQQAKFEDCEKNLLKSLDYLKNKF
jgi:sugar phosphate isomerase/epimerase